MNKIIAQVSWLTSALLVLASLFIVYPTVAEPSIIPPQPTLSADVYALMDFQSGQFLVEHDIDKKAAPASLTKMMTTYAIYHELKKGNIAMNDMVRISKKAWQTGGSKMFVEVGKEVSVENLLKGIVIQSGNDACVAMAEFIAGTEDGFASLMNHYAQQLGMTNTHFTNSTGMPHPEQYTTARDMALLGQALVRDFPDDYAMYSEKSFTFQGIKQHNRNTLLWRDDTVDGIKTGHTEEAGYCLVASALRDNMRLISVIMGAQSSETRTQQSQQLLTYGFRFFKTHKLYAGGEPLKEVKLWMGKEDKLPLGILDDLYITIPRGQYQHLEASLITDAYYEAPATKHAAYGNIEVKLGDQLLVQKPLIALNEVVRGSWWTCLMDKFILFIYKLFGIGQTA